MARKKTKEEYEAEWMGKVYGKSEVCEYSHTDKNGKAYFWCTCLVCGERFGPVYLNHLKSGNTTSCGKCVRNNPEKYYQEYIGKRYGHYVVREYHHRDEHGNAYFLCECDCGEERVVMLGHLKSGASTSCGHCLERTEIGNRYGHYVVREYHHRDENGMAYFLCDCDCGNDGVVVRLDSLKTGNTISCGHCLERTEIGKRYGHWIVKEYHHRDEHGHLYFLCDCDCGNDGIVRLQHLKSGATTSCGCITESIGETNIKNILDENNISYESQKRFEDCKNINTLPFDFYITYDDISWCIEFDGPQHEKVCWGDEEKFKQTQQNDQIKNQYCKDNGIPLIRIPYHKRDTMTIDDLMLGSNYLLK